MTAGEIEREEGVGLGVAPVESVAVRVDDADGFIVLVVETVRETVGLTTAVRVDISFGVRVDVAPLNSLGVAVVVLDAVEK